MLNEGMFAAEGGWVLKPPGYRGGEAYDPNRLRGDEERTVHEEEKNEEIIRRDITLTIRILAAQDLPLPDPADADKAEDFRAYIKCKLHLETGEDEEKEQRKSGGGGGGGGGGPTTSSGKCHVDKDGGDGGDDDEDKKKKKKKKDGGETQKSKTKKGVDPDFEGETMTFADVKGVVEELSFLRSVIPFSYSPYPFPLNSPPPSLISLFPTLQHPQIDDADYGY